MGITLEEERKGFTIVEVMLFLALSGVMLAGVLVSTGSSIANQRYKDSVQDVVDVLRNAYSFVSDTQTASRSKSESACNWLINTTSSKISDAEAGRGRSSCATYGAVVTINGDVIQTTTLIGRDYYDMLMSLENKGGDSESYEAIHNSSSTDLEVLKALQANNIAAHCKGAGTDCVTSVAGNISTRKLKWDAMLKEANYVSHNGNRNLELTLLIYRSPRDGSIRTLAMNDLIRDNNNKPVDYETISSNANLKELGVYKYISNKALTQKDVYFCIDSNGAQSYANNRRVVHIVKNAHSQSGIVLENMDDEIIAPNGKKVECDQ